VAARRVESLSIDLLKPMGELASFGPTGFDKEVEDLKQRNEAVGLRIVLTVENIAVVG